MTSGFQLISADLNELVGIILHFAQKLVSARQVVNEFRTDPTPVTDPTPPGTFCLRKFKWTWTSRVWPVAMKTVLVMLHSAERLLHDP